MDCFYTAIAPADLDGELGMCMPGVWVYVLETSTTDTGWGVGKWALVKRWMAD